MHESDDIVVHKVNLQPNYSAYQLMSIDEKSEELVPIYTHKGQYQYTRLPFGVASAPTIFQETINVMLQGLPQVICYLNDILITGSTEEEHLTNLERVLERLRKYGIQAKRSKCALLKPSVEYLDHRVDATGLHTAPSNVEVVRKAPAPQNVLELRSFLGRVHYYRKFIPNIFTLLQPFNRLLKEDHQWVWSLECMKVFQSAKDLLSSAPVLAYYDPSLPMKMAGVLRHTGYEL